MSNGQFVHQSSRPAGGSRHHAAERAQRHWEAGVKYAKDADWVKAEAAFAKAVRGNPADPLFLLNLARSQMKIGSLDKAVANAMGALALDPASQVGRDIAAACLRQQNRHEECAALLQQVPAEVPLTADYYRNLGEALALAGQHQQAVVALFEVLKHKMDDALSYYRLAVSFDALGRKHEAADCCRTALALSMGRDGDLMAQSLLTYVERELCRWEHAQEDLAVMRRMTAQLTAGSSVWTGVFAHVTLTDDPQEHLQVARSCARFAALGAERFEPVLPRPLGSRLRVGFVSNDLQQHATAHLMAEVFERLDPNRFEVTLYSHGKDDGSPMRERLMRSDARFVDVSKTSDLDVARRIRADGIEVLVDLKGHTKNNRLRIFAYRPAPVQVTFLGFPGTTGADYIDYFVGDAIVSPLDQASHYSEKLALMPRCYQPNDRQRPLPAPIARAQVGLPPDALVLCGFNQPFKLSPEVFDVWCRLLHRLPNAVLWLLQWNEQAPAHLRAEAEARGIAASRMVFAPRVGTQQHIDRMALADVFIDTWPCNGHTTASDALWAGLPVVTYSGRTFASRVAASLLGGVGLHDLITHNLRDYEDKVMALAADAGRRQAIREHLIRARDTAPLFDSTTFTSDFGTLLWRMAERWSQGLAPQHIEAV
jgi:predicted O-linked N-acetylglucosamine transferase (SPINDLY family)